MTTERWNRVNELFHSALHLSGVEREQFLRDHCGDDPEVLEEVQSLLDSHEKAGNFISEGVPPELIHSIAEPYELLVSGETIGVYKILKELGRGGMGAVYLAVRADQVYEKYVAIKLLKRGMDTDEVLRHFRNERQILAGFDHPNIARLLDGGTTRSGIPYFVMEYVEGMPIDEYCDHHRLTITQRLELFRQVCAAVSYAHRRLVIHRDIKPSNIVVTPEGMPKLLDFGVAKILDTEGEGGSTATGIRMMTPEYASPEQAMGLPVTTGSDVYSLGVVLYELLTGQAPYRFQSRSPLEVVRVINTTQPQLPSSSFSTLISEDHQGATLIAAVSAARDTSPDQLKRRLRGDLDNIVLMAIRNETHRRYQSVEQLSEDIRRHLVGLPVIARKDTVVYRMTKFARRNRIAVAAAVLVLLSLIAGVVATTWQAQKAKAEQARAEYAREFGDEIRYIEALLLSTYTAPLHDARRNLKLARDRLKRIEQRMLQGGPPAYGSGHNALGNGFLFLRDYDLARIHLEKAWASGYQEPSTAYALGKALGILYHQALADSDRLINLEMKQQAIQRAQAQYAKPAIEYLARARSSAESPAYVEGLIALYQKRFEEALQKTAEALPISSRPYEVLKLKGDIHFQIGREADAKGDYRDAVNAFALAGKAYSHAAESGRSDLDLYLADANRIIRSISMHNTGVEELVRSGIERCDRAATINSDSDKPYLYKSRVYFQQGITQMYYSSTDPRPAFRLGIAAAEEALKRKKSVAAYAQIGALYLRTAEYETTLSADPRPALTRAVAESQKAIQLDPHDSEAYAHLAGAYFYIGEYQSLHGEDPTPSLTKVIDIYEKDLGSLPKDGYAYNLLGLAYIGLAEYKLKRGADPRKELEHAIQTYRLGMRSSAYAPHLYANLALAFSDRGQYEAANGIDPNQSFQEAIRYYSEHLKRTPESGYGFFNRGLVYFHRAQHILRTGGNADPDTEQAMAHFQKSVEIMGALPLASLQIGATHLLRARSQFKMGKNPSSELAMAKRFLRRYLEQDKTNPEAYLTQGRIEFLSARWFARNGSSQADKLFDSAIENVQKSMELNLRDLAPYLEMASIYRHRAEWNLRTGNSPGKSIDLGLQKAAEAEKIDAEHPELMALRASLLLLKRQDSGEALQLLRQALQKNPFLKSEYGNAIPRNDGSQKSE